MLVIVLLLSSFVVAQELGHARFLLVVSFCFFIDLFIDDSFHTVISFVNPH